MRHKRKKHRLGRTGSERQALMKNMVKSLFLHQRLETTVVKAKEARRLAEKLITLTKEPTLHHRRQAYEALQDRDMVKLLFEKIAPLFIDRASGFTRLIRSRRRLGDGAELAILELTEFRPGKIAKTRPVKDKEKTKEKGRPAPVEKPAIEKSLPEKAEPKAPPTAKKKLERVKGKWSGLRRMFGRKGDKG